MNVLTDNWIKLTNGKKTNVNDILDVPIINISEPVHGYKTALIAFMLLKSYLDKVDEKVINEFVHVKNDGKELGIDQLVFSQPRENTKKLRKDFFIKSDSVSCLCESCCIQSAITISLFSSTAGQGYSAGVLGQRLMIFKRGDTIREIIERNKITRKYTAAEIFKSPYELEFINKTHSSCSLCGDEGSCYTHFRRKPNEFAIPPDDMPLVAKNADNKNLWFSRDLPRLQIMSKINDGSIVFPNEIAIEVGDQISFFSILYDKAKLVTVVDINCVFEDVNFELDASFITKCILLFRKNKPEHMRYDFYRFMEDRYPRNKNFNELAMEYFLRYIPVDVAGLPGNETRLIAMAINKMRERYA